MATDFKQVAVKYLNKDFQTLKRDLINFAQAHHSGAFQDFNESSPGMAVLEFVATAGDMLSFYQDQMFDEMRGVVTRQISIAEDFAKMRGYKPAGKSAATGILPVMIEVPAVSSNGAIVPDPQYLPKLKMGSQFTGPNGVVFETLTDVDFSLSEATENTEVTRMVTGSQYDLSSGLPTYFAVRKEVSIVAGETKTDTVILSDFQQFRQVELSNNDVIEVLSVTDSDGNSWYEVDYLAQDVVYDTIQNTTSDSTVVPYILSLKSVPRRFIVERSITTGKSTIVFGAGDGISFDDQLIPNMANFAIPTGGKSTFSSVAIDPQNFLKTRTLGMSPYNTTLTINYRVGGGPQTNVPPKTIRDVKKAVFEFGSTSLLPSKKSSVISSIECVNLKKTDGGKPAETISEVKANAAAFFAAQDRVVTREDYLARVFSIPAKFGKVDKAFVTKDAMNESAVNIHVLSRDSNGNLAQASPTLIKNIKTYLSKYRMLTEGVNILQTDVINIGIDFGVVVAPRENRNKVLANCLGIVKDMYAPLDEQGLTLCNMHVGEPIVVDDIVSELKKVPGVVGLYNVRIRNIFGTIDSVEYSSVRYDIQANTQKGIIYCQENAIFELKFPNRDIKGEPV